MATTSLEGIANLVEKNSAIYARLPGSKAIRVLEVQPGEPTSRISCNLLVIPDYTEAPVYKAMSYCWGTSTGAVEISCDGAPFSATRNLHTLLERLRSTEESGSIWVDAICINQHDDVERSQQVSIMKQIYTNASRVFVWLGPGDEHMSKSFEAVREIYSTCCGRRSFSRTHGRRSRHVQESSTDALQDAHHLEVSEDFWEKLGPLFRCEWFRRVWVIQEVQSCDDVWVLCGKEGIDWCEIALAARFAYTRENIHSRGKTTGIMFPHRRTWNVYNIPQAIFMATTLRTDVFVPFLQILQATRCFRSTDPRDKIFSMLQHPFERTSNPMFATDSGFPAKRHLGLVPDYTRTVSAVYADVALQSISQTRSLEILSHYWAGIGGMPGIPEWTPRWDVDYAPEHIPLETTLYNACLSLPCNVQIGGRLILQGINLGAVISTAEILTCSRRSEDTGPGCVSRIQVDSIRAAARLAVHDTWKEDAITGTDVKPTRSKERPDQHFADFAAFILHGMPDPPKSFYRSMVEKYCDRCGNVIAHYDAGTPEPILAYRGAPFFADFRDLCLLCYNGSIRCSVPDYEIRLKASPSLHYVNDQAALQELDLAAPKGSSERYYCRLRDTLMCRTWLSTSRGDVGSGSIAVRNGDVVAILFGARVPFLVRRQQDGRYKLIGDCYIDGMMDGQAVQLWRNGRLQEDTFELC